MFRTVFAAAMMTACATTAIAEVTLRATTAAPPKTPWVTRLEDMAKDLSNASDGAMQIEVFPSSQLGTDVETLRQVVRGRIDMGHFSINASASIVPEVALMASPFFWDTTAQADCAIDNHLTEIFSPLFEAKGLKIVEWQELGWQNLFGKEPMLEPGDVAGVKTRVTPAENHDIFWRNTGANGVPLPFSEIATGLQTGLVDAGELPIIPYVAAGVGKLAPHMMETRHIYQPSLLVISTKVWNGLTEDELQKFSASLSDAEELRQSVRGVSDSFVAKHAEDGGVIHELTKEQRNAWAALFTPELQQELIASIGGQAAEVYDAVVAARDACTVTQ